MLIRHKTGWNTHETCRFEEGWEFEWGPVNAGDPGDTLVGYAGGLWTPFGPTDESGMTMTVVPEEDLSKNLWFREVLQEGYIPFTHEFRDEEHPRGDPFSAEVYCHIDVLNFDNYDRIDGPEVGETYYCVAWNHMVEEGGKLTIHKNSNYHDAEFTFLVSQGESLVEEVSFETYEGEGWSDPIMLDPGVYRVEEIVPEGWVLTDSYCEYGGESDGIIIENGHEITIESGSMIDCYFYNGHDHHDGSSLTIHKFSEYGDGEFDFTISGFEYFEEITLETEEGEAWSDPIHLDPGTYSVLELVPEGWILDNVYCEYDNQALGNELTNGYEIIVGDEDSVSCYFYNEYDTSCPDGYVYDEEAGQCVPRNGETYADLEVTKSVDDDTPDVGQQITYIITLTNNGPDVTGNIMVEDLLPSGLQLISYDVYSGTYSSTTGKWTVLSLGVSASTTLTMIAEVESGYEGQSLENVVEITASDATDTDSGNNSASKIVTVNSPESHTPQCSDGIDNDDDGNTDYGFDPGCTSPDDDDETDDTNGGGGGGPGGGGITTLTGGTGGGGNGQVLGAATEAPQQCTFLLTQYLRNGYNNDSSQVSLLQDFLNRHMGENLEVNGIFGDETEDAVERFQWKYRFDVLAPWDIKRPTGIVYLTTRRWINMIECSQVEAPLPPLVEWSQNQTIAVR